MTTVPTKYLGRRATISIMQFMTSVVLTYAPNQDSIMMIALIMHYITSEEAQGYAINDDTVNSL
jgi:hypothetical protein